jgi:multidrug efflux pump subunit AcrA (membrane-fusion protein)
MNARNGVIRDSVVGSMSNHHAQQRDLSAVEDLVGDQDDEQPRQVLATRDMITNALTRFAIPVAIAAAVLAILAFGGLFSNQQETILPAARALDVVVVVAVAESSYDVHRSYLGTIESRRDSRLSFELGGKLNSVTVDEGEAVEKGSILAELDTRILRSGRDVITSQIEAAQARLDELIAGPRVEDIDSAKAQVRRWQSQRKLARVTTKRLVRLTQSKAASQQEFDDSVYSEQVVQAQLDLATSQLTELRNGTRKEQIAEQAATVKQLQAELGTIEINIEKSQLLAPYRGVISARLLDEGEVIASGQPVFELVDNLQLEARVGLPVSSIESVTGLASHQLLYRDRMILAKLKSVRPEKNADTRTVDVVFEIESSAQPASIGDVVRFEHTQTVIETGFWIPTSSMVETYRGLWGCYIAEAENGNSSIAVSRLRTLEVLHREGDLAYVRGELQRAEQVIVSGVHRLVQDQNVHIANQGMAVASR